MLVTDDREDEITYLENFWVHEVGNEVWPKQALCTKKIEKIEEDFPEQVFLNDGTIQYIQDLKWKPSLKDGSTILKRLGAIELDDSFLIDKVYHPKPEYVDKIAKIIRNIRHVAYLKGREVLDGYFAK